MSIIDIYKCADDKNIDIFYIPSGKTAISLPDGCMGVDPEHESVETLAHEIGHIETGCFYTDKTDIASIRKMEEVATRFAIQLLVPRIEFIEYVKDGYILPWMVADYFDISEEFAKKVIKYYKSLL